MHLTGPTVDHRLNLTGVNAKIGMREPADVTSPVVVSGAIIVSLYTKFSNLTNRFIFLVEG